MNLQSPCLTISLRSPCLANKLPVIGHWSAFGVSEHKALSNLVKSRNNLNTINKLFRLNFGVIYTTIFKIFTCEIIENIHIYLFQYFLNFPLITKKINAKNLKMCKDNTIKKSKPLASVDLYRELRNFYSISCTLYIEE